MTTLRERTETGVTVHELSDTWTPLEVGSLDDAVATMARPGAFRWIDIDARTDEPIAALTALRERLPELHELRPERMGGRSDNPPAYPPKAKAFRDFVFARVYWLHHGAHDDEHGVLTQELHLLLGRTFAITVRREVLGWPREIPDTPEQTLPVLDHPGVDLEPIREEVLVFLRDRPDRQGTAGLAIGAMILDMVTDAVFDTLDGLRRYADTIEVDVLDRGWIWQRKRWPQQDTQMQGLRWLLRQIRWSFMPADEIDEFCSGPFLGLDEREPWLGFKFTDIGREADRALDTAKDVIDQAAQTVALRDTMKTDRLNNTMYVLTVVATVLLIPAVISGIYGMNFDTLPWVHSRVGFAGAVLAMVALSTGMWLAITWFLRRH
jgi:hypothetical protein